MNNFSKILGIAAIGASVAKARMIQRCVDDFARIIALAIATGFMAGALLIGVFYVAYQGLLYYGLEPLPAQILIAALAAITVAALISFTSLRLRRLKSIPEQIVHTEFPFASRLNGIADSFLDGLLNPQKQQ